jgi:hypothetical protein
MERVAAEVERRRCWRRGGQERERGGVGGVRGATIDKEVDGGCVIGGKEVEIGAFAHMVLKLLCCSCCSCSFFLARESASKRKYLSREQGEERDKEGD